MHIVHNQTLIPLQVLRPVGIRNFRLSHPCLKLQFLRIGFGLHSIQVFVQSVEHEGKEFLGVVLLVAAELGCEAADCGFEVVWGVGSRSAEPQVPYHLAKGFSQLSFGAEDVVEVQVFFEVVLGVKEVVD